MTHILIDSHEDLAWNVLTFGRDYTRGAAETRQRERDSRSPAPHYNGDTLLGWPDYVRGRVAVVFATLFAAPARHQFDAWDTQSYRNTTEAHASYQAQLDVYHRMVEQHPDKFRLIQSRPDLAETLAAWEKPDAAPPVGLVVLMENAEGVREPAELEMWWARGVRLIGPAWAGTRFCGGTGEPGPLTKEGYALLDVMAHFGFTLDLSHMDERAVLQALDHYPGPIAATHANAAALLNNANTNRHLSDEVIRGIAARGGVIGVVPYNHFLQVGWTKSDGREAITLQHVVAHIDHICQLTGNTQHAGLGTDFDGGFGWQSVPGELDTIADLGKIAPLLTEKGYTEADIAAVFGQNWRNHLEKALPTTS